MLRVAGELTAADPISTITEIEQTVVYAAPEADITNEVLSRIINQRK